MKRNLFIIFSLMMAFSLGAGFASAQDSDPVELESDLGYSDYTIKGYSLSFFGGQYSGIKYLENQKLWPRAVMTDGASDIINFQGEVLAESRQTQFWDAAHKEIEPGPAYGAKLGVYISDNFHIDVLGTYGTGTATISMLQIESPDNDPNFVEHREDLNWDHNFKMYRGGFAFQYDSNNFKIYGLRPRIGFGLGGIINRYTKLADVTALYLDANFGLDYPLTNNINIAAGVDLTTYAFKVEELGYSNMISYGTFTIGLTYFIDVLPESVRSAHNVEVENRK